MKKLLFGLFAFVAIQSQALEVGEQAPCVILDHQNAQGEISEHCIRDMAEDQTHTLIEFFSITCSACKENLPIITALGQDIQKRATTRLISIDRNVDSVKEYSKMNNILFEVGFDNERFARKAYQVSATPTLFILDKNFNVVYKHIGVLSPDDVSKIKNLILSK